MPKMMLEYLCDAIEERISRANEMPDYLVKLKRAEEDEEFEIDRDRVIKGLVYRAYQLRRWDRHRSQRARQRDTKPEE